MSRFPTAGHLVSWAGLCPSNKESAGKRMKGPVNRGNVWLRGIMGEVACASVKKSATYFYAQFNRVAHRRGRNKAAVAVAHSLLVLQPLATSSHARSPETRTEAGTWSWPDPLAAGVERAAPRLRTRCLSQTTVF